MTSIDTLPTQPSSAEKEPEGGSRIEALQPGMENPPFSLAEAGPLEIRGDFSRMATFEIGSNVNDKGVATREIDPNNSHAVVLDIWTKGDTVLALPRSEADKTEIIADKGWNLADLPKGLVIGRERNDIWQQKTGESLPPEVSSRHFGIVLRDGELLFADVGSSNGTRMETAVLNEEEITGSNGETEAREGQTFTSFTGSLVEPSSPIYTRLNTAPSAVDETSLSTEGTLAKDENEKSGYDLESTDRRLQGMQIAATNLETTLGLEPTKTFPAHLSEVAAVLAGDIRVLHELRTEINPEVNSPVDLKLTQVESTARMAEAQASATASSIYGESYESVAGVHSDRGSVERMLHEYSEGIIELRRLINE